MEKTRSSRRLRNHRPTIRVEALETRSLLSALPLTGPSLFGSPLVAAGPPSSTGGSSSDFNAIDGTALVQSLYHVDGTGMTAAVIDTGVDYNSVGLGSGFGSGDKVVAGYDFADQSSDPMATWQHGTAVAGILASNNPSDPGVAPGADVVALKVFNQANHSDFQWVANALQWVLNNYQKYGISVVNLSITDGNNYANNWFANDGGIGQEINGLVQQLAQVNIPVVTAAGNSFNGQQGMGFPAILGSTISVTATDGASQLASDAQRLGPAFGGTNATDLAAPGVNLIAPAGGSQFDLVNGTSFAAPQVSGAILLLQQIYQSRFGHLPTVDQVKGWLEQGGDPITDPATGVTVERLDLSKAASLIPQPNPSPTSPPAANPDTSTGSTPVATPAGPTGQGAPAPPSSPPSPPSQPPAPPAQEQAQTLAATPPANPPSTPPAGPPPSSAAPVQLFVNGQSAGQVSLPDPSSPWNGIYSLFSTLGSFQTISKWTPLEAGSMRPLRPAVVAGIGQRSGHGAGEAPTDAGPAVVTTSPFTSRLDRPTGHFARPSDSGGSIRGLGRLPISSLSRLEHAWSRG